VLDSSATSGLRRAMTQDIVVKTQRQKEKHFARWEKVCGQFLTPSQVAEFIAQFVTASNAGRNLGIDPACGDGVFLKALVNAGFTEVVGIDIDPQVLGQLPSGLRNRVKILPCDGLQPLVLMEGSADAVVGNPPFSAKYGRISDSMTLSNFKIGKGKKTQAIELLFLERFLQLASPKGVVGIILPQGVFSALPLKYVRTFLKNEATVVGIVSLPRGIFSNRTTSKTSILFVEKQRRAADTFIGIAERLDDLPALLETYIKRRELASPPAFWVNLTADTFEPEFYWSFKTSHLSFKPGLPVSPLEALLSDMHCGGAEYGEKRKFANEGIRFISAKTITPFSIDFTRDEKYVEPNSLMDKKWAHVLPGDVLFVRVGVGCAGRASAIVNSSDVGVADDWIYILRPKTISPYYLALFFYTRFGKIQVDRLKRGVGTVNIPQRLLKRILIPIPPESFQQDISTKYEEMVRLRKLGCIAEARDKFEQMKISIEVTVSQHASLGAEGG
jgi:type I restriction enzyme M protein